MIYSGAPTLYVDVHRASVGFRTDFWVTKCAFKFPAETCCDPGEKQPVSRDSLQRIALEIKFIQVTKMKRKVMFTKKCNFVYNIKSIT